MSEVPLYTLMVTETGSYLRLIDSCITSLKAQGLSRTCDESKEEEEEVNPNLAGEQVGATAAGRGGEVPLKGRRGVSLAAPVRGLLSLFLFITLEPRVERYNNL